LLKKYTLFIEGISLEQQKYYRTEYLKSKDRDPMEYTTSKINGDSRLESITLLNKLTNKEFDLAVDGVFVFIGWLADTEHFKGFLEMDEYGFIKADETCRTNIPGYL